jgi:DegV family protein with EDD domain
MIRIIADTTSNIPPGEAEELGIYFLPQIIIFGEKAYRDDHELTTAEFLEKLRASPVLPKTAAPPPLLYQPIYESLTKQNDTIIVICPSQLVSGTYRSASDAALEFPDADIRVIDTQTIGPASEHWFEWRNSGRRKERVRILLLKSRRDGQKARIYFYVDTLSIYTKGAESAQPRLSLALFCR